MKRPLENQTALVTGAAQGIGLAICRTFLEAGASVAAVDRNANALAALAQELGSNAHTIVADLTQPAQCTQVVSETEKRFGRLDILVNNAYAGPYKSITTQDDESWQLALAIGLTANMALCRAALPSMVSRRSGTIINLGSTNSFIPSHSMAAYAAVKGGIVNLTRQLAVEYGEHNIRVNCLCPGAITDPRREAEFAAKPIEKARFTCSIPLRRLGTADECAQAALFLASPASSYMTGQSLILDGGQSVQNSRMATWPFENALKAHGA